MERGVGKRVTPAPPFIGGRAPAKGRESSPKSAARVFPRAAAAAGGPAARDRVLGGAGVSRGAALPLLL